MKENYLRINLSAGGKKKVDINLFSHMMNPDFIAINNTGEDGEWHNTNHESLRPSTIGNGLKGFGIALAKVTESF